MEHWWIGAVGCISICLFLYMNIVWNRFLELFYSAICWDAYLSEKERKFLNFKKQRRFSFQSVRRFFFLSNCCLLTCSNLRLSWWYPVPINRISIIYPTFAPPLHLKHTYIQGLPVYVPVGGSSALFHSVLLIFCNWPMLNCSIIFFYFLSWKYALFFFRFCVWSSKSSKSCLRMGNNFVCIKILIVQSVLIIRKFLFLFWYLLI